MKKPISGQYKLDLDTGQVSIVASEVGSKPVKEQQISFLYQLDVITPRLA
jgi:hypothetical protein